MLVPAHFTGAKFSEIAQTQPFSPLKKELTFQHIGQRDLLKA
jgi:hypothetical protein